MNRDRIEVLEYPANTPAELFDSSGVLTLDLPPDFTFQLTERLEELTDINRIQGAGVLGFDLPYTIRNDFIFQDFHSPNIPNNQFGPVKVRLVTKGGTVLPQNLLWIVGMNDRERSYSCEVVNSDDFWGVQAEALTLNQLDYGTFVLNYTNLRYNNWINPQWEEGQDPFYFPMVHYGGFNINPDNWTVEDFLPWVSLPATLKMGFSEIGWAFESPLMNSAWFKRLWMYVLAEDLDYPNKGGLYRVQASTFGPINLSAGSAATPFVWDTVTADPGGNLQAGTAAGSPATLYVSAQPVSSLITFQLRTSVDNGANPGTLIFDIYDADNGISIHEYHVSLTANQSTFVDFIWDVRVDEGRRLAWRVRMALDFVGGSTVQLTQMTFLGTAASKRIYEGDTIPISDLISPDYTFLDFIKGVAHLCNLKFRTDWSTRTVYAYPQTQSDVHGDILEGFFLPSGQSIDISSYVIPESRQISFPREKPNRYLRLSFADTDDARVDELELPDTEPLFGRTLDLGESLKEETEESQNPFFEPTANVDHYELNLPACWDNDDGEISKKIGPRVIYAYGIVLQKDPTTGAVIFWNLQGNRRDRLPYAAQLPEAYIDDENGFIGYPDKSVVYGVQDIDLYTMFYIALIRDLQYLPSYEFLIMLDDNLFEDLDFRHRVFLQYGGEAFVGRIYEKRDYRTNEELSTPVVIRPEYQIIE